MQVLQEQAAPPPQGLFVTLSPTTPAHMDTRYVRFTAGVRHFVVSECHSASLPGIFETKHERAACSPCALADSA